MGKRIDCAYLAQLAKDETKRAMRISKVEPKLAVFQIGDNAASEVYVRNKKRDCDEVGIICDIYKYTDDVERETVKDAIADAIKQYNGVMIQLPVAGRYADLYKLIPREKDVDGFNVNNVGYLWKCNEHFPPCTAEGVIYILEKSGVHIEGANAVVVGRSDIAGKPIAAMLLNRNATVTICHSYTKNLSEITRRADILVAAVGKPGLITADMVKEGATVIDVGINRGGDGKLCGDVDTDGVLKVARYVTPVPGGVGLMTRAMLLRNVTQAAIRQRDRELLKKGVK